MFKTLSIKKVFHIGSMEEGNRRSHNFEGKGLSVSITPREWLRICRGNISGQSNQLFNPNARFALFFLNEELERELILFGLKNNYIKEQNVYVYNYYDDEMEEELQSIFISKEDALEELEEDELENLELIKKYKSSSLLKKTLSPVDINEYNPFRNIFSLYIQEKHKNIDGIWYNSDIDVLRYQAPSGLIFDHKIECWTRKKIEDNQLPDLIEENIPKILTY